MVRGSQNRERRWKSDPAGVDCPLCAAHVHGQLKVKAKLLHLNNFHADVEDLAVFNGFMGVQCQRCPACSKICLDSGRHQRASAAGTECYRQWTSNHSPEASQETRATQDSDEDDDFSQPRQVAVGISPALPTLAPPTMSDAPTRQTRSQARSQAPEPPVEVGDVATVTNGPPPGLPVLAAVPGRTTFLRSELLDLVAFYGKYALYVIHWTWKERMARITKRLMDEIKDCTDTAQSGRSEIASAALLLLPGVLHAMVKHRLGKTADLMKTLDEYPRSPAKFLALEAQNLKERILRQQQLNDERWACQKTNTLARVTRQKARIEKLVMEGRLSAATVQVEAMDALLTAPDNQAPPQNSRPLSNEEACTVLRQYNPVGRPERDSLPDWDPDQHAPLQLEEAQVRDAIRAVNSQASAGYSAWTFSLIRTLAETTGAITGGSWTGSITRLFNLMLRDRLSRDWWTPSRAVLLPKGSNTWRPLGIGDAFYRILGKAVMIAIGDRIGQEIRPIQLGVGTSGGSEIAGRMANVMLAAHHDNALINLDLSNAFNTIPRRLMWRGVLRHAPDLGHWFRWAYGQPTDLRLTSGQVACRSETGSRQGDPLASLIFCLGFQFLLEDVSWELRRVCGNLPPPVRGDEETRDRVARDDELMRAGVHAMANPFRPSPEATDEENERGRAEHEARKDYVERRYANPDRAGVIAYMDDVNIFMPADMLVRMCPYIQEVFDNGGMTLNIDKCQVLFATPENKPDRVGPFPVQIAGTLSMGVPTGPTAHRLEHTRQLLEAMKIPARCISHLSPPAGFGIIRYCINARAGYLARVTEAPEVRTLMEQFDRHIDDCLEVLLSRKADAPEQRRHEEAVATATPLIGRVFAAEIEPPPTPPEPPDPPELSEHERRLRWLYGSAIPRIRGLPTHLSGLGIPRYAGVAGEIACLRSRALTERFIRNHHTLASLRYGTHSWPAIQMGTTETIREWVSPWQEPADDPERANQPQGHETESMLTTAKAIFQNMHGQLQQELTQHQMEAEQAFFLSAAYTCSGKWLHAGAFYGRYFNAYRFQNGEFLEALRLRCLINPLACDIQHGGCRLCLCGADISREVTHALDCTRYCGRFLNRRHNMCREAFVNVLRDIPDYSPTIETEVAVGLDRKRCADVVIHETGANEPIIIDFAVADPAAPRYRAADEPSHVTAGAAGKFRAEEKRALYRQIGVRVFPAVLEATGRPHDELKQWLKDLGARYKTDALGKFLSKSSIVIQRQNAQAVMFLRSFRLQCIANPIVR